MSRTLPPFDDLVVPEPNTGCHLWMGSAGVTEYGTYGHHLAHRVAFVRAFGPIPPKLFVCHRCDVRSCVNPDHLFLGTNTDNMRDASRKGRLKGTHTLTHCRKGHLFDDANTYRHHGAQMCRVCMRINKKNRRALRRSQGLAFQ